MLAINFIGHLEVDLKDLLKSGLQELSHGLVDEHGGKGNRSSQLGGQIAHEERLVDAINGKLNMLLISVFEAAEFSVDPACSRSQEGLF